MIHVCTENYYIRGLLRYIIYKNGMSSVVKVSNMKTKLFAKFPAKLISQP